eukprot:scaffold72361_cov40-Cyclotella_meneghiniana.AAC.3
MAEGMPSGRSLVLSSGSFSKATRYVVRRILMMAGGGEKFVEGFKHVIMCGEGEAVVADERLSEGGYRWAQAM